MFFSLRHLFVLTAAVLGVFLWIFYFQDLPYRSAPKQPIAFSHRVHFERGIACIFCHADVAKSDYAGMPAVMKCMGCHRVVIPYYPQVQILHRYWSEQKPIPWVRVFWVPQYVHFPHQPHILAGIPCGTCHGDVGHEERVAEVVNFNMGTCITCHRNHGARTDCFQACHH